MRIFRVLKKQRFQNDDKYLIHWVGKHKQASTWHTHSQIASKHPQQIDYLNSYDRQLKRTCKQLFETYLKDNQIQTNHSQPKAKEKDNTENLNQQSNEESKAASQVGKKIKKRHLRIGSQRFLTKAQALVDSNQSMRSIPAEEFKLNIQTDGKSQNNWIFGDKVLSILEKEKGESSYRVKWNDNSIGMADEEELIENESIKLCRFWKKQIFQTSGKKSSKKEI